MKSAVVLGLVVALSIPILAQTQAAPLRDAVDREGKQLARSVEVATSQTGQAHQRSWAARHAVLTGTLIGFGIGFPIGAATCKYPGAEGPCAYYTYPGNARLLGGTTIGLIGAGLGAGIGALIGSSGR
jgi:hypothetical protein